MSKVFYPIDAKDSVEVLSAQGANGCAGSAFEMFNKTLIQQIQKSRTWSNSYQLVLMVKGVMAWVRSMKMYDLISLNLIFV